MAAQRVGNKSVIEFSGNLPSQQHGRLQSKRYAVIRMFDICNCLVKMQCELVFAIWTVKSLWF